MFPFHFSNPDYHGPSPRVFISVAVFQPSHSPFMEPSYAFRDIFQEICREMYRPIMTTPFREKVRPVNIFTAGRNPERKDVVERTPRGEKVEKKVMDRPRSAFPFMPATPRSDSKVIKKTPAPVASSQNLKKTEKQKFIKGKNATYSLGEKLGEGGFGTVFKGKGPGGVVAIKKATQERTMKLLCTWNLSKGGDIGQEIKTLKMLTGHPNIVCIKDYAFIEKDVYIIMEYCQGNLYNSLKNCQLPEQKALVYITQLAKGLHHIHQKGLIHRDMKPQNILLSSGVCKIADFGLATFKNNVGEVAGTDGYIAPESYSGKYGPKTDIYALGFILWDMLTGIKPGVSERNPKAIKDVKISEETRRLICKMIDTNPEERPSAMEVLKKAESILGQSRSN